MQVGDLVRLRPNFWKAINDSSPCSRMGTVVRVNRIGKDNNLIVHHLI